MPDYERETIKRGKEPWHNFDRTYKKDIVVKSEIQIALEAREAKIRQLQEADAAKNATMMVPKEYPPRAVVRPKVRGRLYPNFEACTFFSASPCFSTELILPKSHIRTQCDFDWRTRGRTRRHTGLTPYLMIPLPPQI